MDNAAEKNTAEAGAKARSAEDFSEWNSTSFPTVNPALQAYLRELGKLPRFSLDEQVALGERILAAENRWRELLAAFGSAAQWQTDFLNCKDQEFWSEQFIPSVPISELEPEKLIRHLKKCENTAALLYDSFVRGDLQETGQLRQKMIAELNLYKLSSDVVRQFHEELLLTAETRRCWVM